MASSILDALQQMDALSAREQASSSTILDALQQMDALSGMTEYAPQAFPRSVVENAPLPPPAPEPEPEPEAPGLAATIARAIPQAFGASPSTVTQDTGFMENAYRAAVKETGTIASGLAELFGADEVAAEMRAMDTGYVPRFDTQRIKDSFAKGDYLSLAGDIVGFSAEQGIKSIPWMVGAAGGLTLFAALVGAQTGRIARERATNDGREKVTIGDKMAAFAPALLSLGLERIGTRALMGLRPGFKGGRAAPVRTLGGVAAAGGRGIATEAGTEAAEEAIEELGGTLGTQAGVNPAAVGEAALFGALGGGPMGGAIRTTAAAAEAVSNRILDRSERAALEPEAEPATVVVSPAVIDADEAAALSEAQPAATDVAPVQTQFPPVGPSAEARAAFPPITPVETAIDTRRGITPTAAFLRPWAYPDVGSAQVAPVEFEPSGLAPTPAPAPAPAPTPEEPTATDVPLAEAAFRPSAPTTAPLQPVEGAGPLQPVAVRSTPPTPKEEGAFTQQIRAARAPAPKAAPVQVKAAPVQVKAAPKPKPVPKPKPKAMAALYKEIDEVNAQLEAVGIPKLKKVGKRVAIEAKLAEARGQITAARAAAPERTGAQYLSDPDPGVAWNPLIQSVNVLAESPEAPKALRRLFEPMGRVLSEMNRTNPEDMQAVVAGLENPQISEAVKNATEGKVDFVGMPDFQQAVRALRDYANQFRGKTAPELPIPTVPGAQQPIEETETAPTFTTIEEALAAADAARDPEAGRATAAEQQALLAGMNTVAAQMGDLSRRPGLRDLAPEVHKEIESIAGSAFSSAQGTTKRSSAERRKLIARAQAAQKQAEAALAEATPVEPAKPPVKVTVKKRRRRAPVPSEAAPDPRQEHDAKVREAKAASPAPKAASPAPEAVAAAQEPIASLDVLRSRIESGGMRAGQVIDGLLAEASRNSQSRAGQLEPILRALQRQGIGSIPIEGTTVTSRFWGRYNPIPDTIQLTMGASGNLAPDAKGKFTQLLVHEMVHAATVHRLQKNNEAAQHLEKLRQYVVSTIEGTPNFRAADYALKDVHEFVAYGLSSAEFQQRLDAIPLPRELQRNGRETSVWKALVETVRRLFRRPPREGQVLEQFLQDSATLLEADIARPGPTDPNRGDVYANVIPPTLMTAEGNLEPVPLDRGMFEYGPAPQPPPDPETRRALRRWGVDARNFNRKQWYRILPSVEQIRYNLPLFQEGARNSLHRYRIEMDKYLGTTKKRQAGSSGLVRDYQRQKSKKGHVVKTMEELAFAGTMMGQHPDLPWGHPRNIEARKDFSQGRLEGLKGAHQNAYRQWQQEVAPHRGVVSLYDAVQAELRKTRQDHMDAAMEMTAKQLFPDDAHLKTQVMGLLNNLERSPDWRSRLLSLRPLMTQEQYARIEELAEAITAKVPGPYFPLRRDGDYVTYGKLKIREEHGTLNAAQARAGEIRTEYPGAYVQIPKTKTGYKVVANARYMELFPTESAALEARDALEARGFEVSSGLAANEELRAGTPLAELLRIADQDHTSDAVKNEMRQAILSLVPEIRHLRSSLNRKYVAGYDTDLQTVLAQHLVMSNRHIASLQHSPEISAAVGEMKARIRVLERDRHPQAVRARQMLQELEARRDLTQAPTDAVADRAWDRVRQLVFLDYLFGVSFPVLNMTQPLLVGYPELSKFGSGQAAKHLTGALGAVTRYFPRSFARAAGEPSTYITDVIGEFRRLANDRTIPTAKQTQFREWAEVLEVALERDRLSSTMHEEMATVAFQSPTKVGRGFDKITRLASIPGQYVELNNRMVMTIAGYSAAREAGQTPGEARETALQVSEDTNFNYTMWNRAKFLQRGIGRLFGVFKTYGISMSANIVRYVHGLVKGQTKEEKQAAARSLIFLMATHGALAGLAGSLLAEPIRIVLLGVGAIIDDDDDFTGPFDDLDASLRRFLIDMDMDPELATSILHGFPVTRPLGQRVGLDSLFFLETPNVNDSISQITVDAAVGIFGAPGATVRDWAKALDTFREGEALKALGDLVPLRAFQDIRRAINEGTEGIKDSSGRVMISPDDFDYLDAALRASGFEPNRVWDYRQLTQRKFSQQKPAQARAKALREQFYKAQTGAERDEALQNIFRFNRMNPVEAIAPKSLFQGMIRYRRAEALGQQGLIFGSPKANIYYGTQP